MATTVKYLLIILGASCLLFPMLGQVHLFDWDEINFAECAREMIQTNNYLQVQIDYQPFWEKPPLFIWLQVLSMKVFGVNEYAARFPNALVGVITMVTIFYVGRRVANEKLAMIWVALYACSWLPHFYFKSGIIDPTFNLFIFLAFTQVHFARHTAQKILHSILAGIFLGLAVLTKGPAAILVALLALVALIATEKGLKDMKTGHIAVIALCAFFTTSIWFGLEVLNNGWWMVNEFITYQLRLFTTEDAGHGGPFFYHFVVLLLGCFPASVFLFQKPGLQLEKDTGTYKRWMWIMFWVVLLLFSIVKTKIVHYSSLCYFPLTFIAAVRLYGVLYNGQRLQTFPKLLLVVIGCLLALAITFLPLAGLYKTKLIPLIKDPFAVANMDAAVSWHLSEMVWGIVYLVVIIWTVVLFKKKPLRSAIILAVAQLVLIEVTVIHFTPKIEAFSQRAAIDFFKHLEGKDVYVKVLGYKSYAQLFYSKKMPQVNQNHNDEGWLLNGEIDKPAYFVCKITNADKFRNLPQLVEIGSENGFVFFKRR